MTPPRTHPPALITSLRNAAVVETRRLERDRREREHRGVYVTWGLHTAAETLDAGVPIVRAFVSAEAEQSAAGRDLMSRLPGKASLVLRVSGRILEAIAEGAGDQGVLLVVRRPSFGLAEVVEHGATLILAAHGVQDPGNLGSMVRTALSSGAGAFLALEGSADPYSSRAVRAGAGAHGRLPVIATTAAQALPVLTAAGFQIVAADVRGESRPDAVDFAPPTVLVMGSEGRGLPPALLDRATRRVRIPMWPHASSLNVHAAAAILLYEAQRQRGYAGGR